MGVATCKGSAINADLSLRLPYFCRLQYSWLCNRTRRHILRVRITFCKYVSAFVLNTPRIGQSTDEGSPVPLIGVSPPPGTPRAALKATEVSLSPSKVVALFRRQSEISLGSRARARFDGNVSVAGIFNFQGSRRSVNNPFTIRR